MNFKKILLVLSFCSTILFGFDINNINSIDSKSSEKKEDLVIYKDMLSYLQNSEKKNN